MKAFRYISLPAAALQVQILSSSRLQSKGYSLHIWMHCSYTGALIITSADCWLGSVASVQQAAHSSVLQMQGNCVTDMHPEVDAVHVLTIISHIIDSTWQVYLLTCSVPVQLTACLPMAEGLCSYGCTSSEMACVDVLHFDPQVLVFICQTFM